MNGSGAMLGDAPAPGDGGGAYVVGSPRRIAARTATTSYLQLDCN